MTIDPHLLFENWLAQASAGEPNDPNAVALATVSSDGRPSLRMVLLKGHDQRGFVFYTNLESRKGVELAAGSPAALLFHWKSLRRQVRVEGPVERVSDAEADAYFASRERLSRLGAWASDQSRVLTDRAVLEDRLHAAVAEFEGRDVPRPPHWSGYRVLPASIEFWEDGAHRLHQRRVFTADASAEGGWSVGLLNP